MLQVTSQGIPLLLPQLAVPKTNLLKRLLILSLKNPHRTSFKTDSSSIMPKYSKFKSFFLISVFDRDLKKKVSENDKSQFHLSKISGVVRDLVKALQITIVDSKDLYTYETD